MKNRTTLYNMIFPIWMLCFFPQTWIVVLPANFIIDFLVIALTMKHLKITEVFKKSKKVILKVWVMGFVADIFGALGMISTSGIFSNNFSSFGVWWSRNMSNQILFSTYSNPLSFIIVCLCVVLSAFMIYIFNYNFCLKKIDISNAERKKLSISLAVFTAPYLFLVPTQWFM